MAVNVLQVPEEAEGKDVAEEVGGDHDGPEEASIAGHGGRVRVQGQEVALQYSQIYLIEEG